MLLAYFCLGVSSPCVNADVSFSFVSASRGKGMSLLPSHVITTKDGATVHAFVSDDGALYRACSGDKCAYCSDVDTARAYLSYWSKKPH